MEEFLSEYYLWIKGLHIIFVICWMVGLFYLPRLFVYHCSAKKGGEADQTFKVMEHKLLWYITTPAMVLSYLFGVALLMIPGVVIWSMGWIHIKLGAVLLLTAFHLYLVGCSVRFKNGENEKPERFYRIINEIPSVLLIVIVLLVCVKPF